MDDNEEIWGKNFGKKKRKKGEVEEIERVAGWENQSRENELGVYIHGVRWVEGCTHVSYTASVDQANLILKGWVLGPDSQLGLVS